MIYNPSFAFGLGDDADLSSKDYAEPNFFEGQGKHTHPTFFIIPELVNANNIILYILSNTIIFYVFSRCESRASFPCAQQTLWGHLPHNLASFTIAYQQEKVPFPITKQERSHR